MASLSLVSDEENNGSGMFTGPSAKGPAEPGEEVEATAETIVDGEVVDEQTEVAGYSDPGTAPGPMGRPSFMNAAVQYELTYDAVTSYQAEVEQDPAQSLTIHMDYGDGSSEVASVPQGSGTAVVAFSHSFYHPATPGGPQTGTYTQSATVLETGFSATSTTIHDC